MNFFNLKEKMKKFTLTGKFPPPSLPLFDSHKLLSANILKNTLIQVFPVSWVEHCKESEYYPNSGKYENIS